MGKASDRRRSRRQEYLQRLALRDPDRFLQEWSKRLDSWSQDAGRLAGRLIDENGRPAARAFSLVDEALGELAGCGPEAEGLARATTEAVMTDSCGRAVAREVDGRMYRLSNSRSNQRLMEVGTCRPPK